MMLRMMPLTIPQGSYRNPAPIARSVRLRRRLTGLHGLTHDIDECTWRERLLEEMAVLHDPAFPHE